MSDSVNALIARGVNPLEMATQAVQLQTGRYNLQQAQLQPAYQSMRMLMATNPDASWDDVMGALAQSKRIGANVGGLVQNANETMTNGGKASDFLRAQSLGGMTPWEQGMLAGPQQHQFQTAEGTYYGTMGGPWSSNAGTFTQGGFVAHGVSPEWGATRVPVTGPDGRTYMVPQGSLMGSGGGGGPASGGGQGGGGQGTSASQATYNFGNIRAPGGGFASYATPQAGIAAMASNLGAYQDQHGINTLNGITARWAPKGDGANDPVAYANTVSKLTGIDPNAKLDLHDPATLSKIIPAMAQVEHGRPMLAGGDVASALGSPSSQSSGPFVGATAAQPVSGPQYFPASPGGGGSGGSGIPGVGPQTPYGPVLTPPAPWMSGLWEQSAKQYSADVDREGGLAMRIQPWQSALATLKASPDLKTGPTSQDWNKWASTLQQWGVSLPSMPADSLSAYQELGKNLARGLQNAGAGSPSDMARLEAEAASPNINMVRDAIQQLAARQIGYERFQMARLKYFKQLHPGEDTDQYANQYRQQTNKWASSLDPVAFGADNMTPQDIQTYRKGLTPQQDEVFLRSITEAHKLFPEVTPGGQ